MVSGAIHGSRGEKADAKDYIQLIRLREAGVQIWPNLKNNEPES